MPERYLRVECVRRCGQPVIVPLPESLGPPRPNPVARWWRRRTLRLRHHRDAYRLGCTVRDRLTVHAIFKCPVFAAEEAAWENDDQT